MLPEKLSTDLTSLSVNVERLSVVVEMVIGADGSLQDSDVYRARMQLAAVDVQRGFIDFRKDDSPAR